MKTTPRLFIILITLLLSGVTAAEEPMTKLVFARAGNDTWQTKSNGKEVILADKQKTNRSPEVWTGDLQIRDLKTGRLCSSSANMIAEVFAKKNGRIIIAVTEVGAGDYFSFIEIDTCKSIYPELHGYSQRPHIKNNKIVLGPVCEQLEAGKAFCSAAEIYALDADARPVLQENESMARTVQVLGVGFKGGRLVENPKTKNAKLLPEEKDDGWLSAIKKWFSP